mgnify:CR=1 FL=1
MEHPLIGDLNNLTLDELNNQISVLYKKLNIATQSGNGQLCHQLRMVLESYSNKYQERLQETAKNNNFEDKIQIK